MRNKVKGVLFYLDLVILCLLFERIIRLAFYLQRLDLVFAGVEDLPKIIWEAANGNGMLSCIKGLSLQCAGLAFLSLCLALFHFRSGVTTEKTNHDMP